MLVNYNPDDYEVEVKNTVCEHHKKHPNDRNYAGCGCTSSYIGKKEKENYEKE